MEISHSFHRPDLGSSVYQMPVAQTLAALYTRHQSVMQHSNLDLNMSRKFSGRNATQLGSLRSSLHQLSITNRKGQLYICSSDYQAKAKYINLIMRLFLCTRIWSYHMSVNSKTLQLLIQVTPFNNDHFGSSTSVLY